MIKKFSDFNKIEEPIVQEDVMSPAPVDKTANVQLLESFNNQYTQFNENIAKAEEFIKLLEVAQTNQQDLIKKQEVENLLTSHLILVNENIETLRSAIKGINTNDMARLESLVDQVNDKAIELTSYIDRELAKSKSLTIDLDYTFNKKSSVLENKLEQYSENVDYIKKEADNLQIKIAENTEFIVNVKEQTYKKIDSLYEEVKDVNDNIVELSEVYDTTINPALQRLNQFESNLNNLDGKVKTYNEELGFTKQEISRAINDINKIFINEKYQALDRKVQKIEEMFDTLSSQQVIVETKEIPYEPKIHEPDERIAQTASDLDKYLTDKSFQQPKVVEISANFTAVQAKLRFLEQAIGRIAATGPGGGEVNLRWLDDIDRSTIGDGKYLRYNNTKKKFEFVTLSGSGAEVDTLDSVTDRGNTTTNGITVGNATADYFQLDITPATAPTITTGMLAWNNQDKTFDMGLLNGVILQAGQEMHMYVKAYETISDGQAVMFAGAEGENILVRKYDPSVVGFIPEWFVGVATQNLAHNAFGYVTVYGKVRGLNTNAYNNGDILYANNAVVGGLTSTPPSPGNPHIIVAAVTKKSGGDGHIMVRPNIRPGLGDLPDVNITSPSNGQVLKYDSTLGYWANATDATGAGGSGIALTDLSVNTTTASSGGSLSYNSGTGVFTFAPASVPAAQIQSDWTQTNTSSLDYIKNKPTLATVATSGSYTDLSNKPSIPTVYDSTITVAAGTGMSGGGTFTVNQSSGSTITLNSTITQYTDTLARSAITLSTGESTNGGALSYNSSTGAFTFQPATAYTLPTASASVLGGVKVGTGLSIDGSGVLYASGSPTFTNITTTGQIIESFQSYTTAITGSPSITFSCTNGNIWMVAPTGGPGSAWTALFTNLAITTGQATNITMIVSQGSTPHIPSAVSINGTSVTVDWQGGSVPTGNANKLDAIAYSVLQTGASTYVVFGQLVTFG